jgi:hypothetical protein
MIKMKNKMLFKLTILLLTTYGITISCNIFQGDEPKLLDKLNLEKRNFDLSVYYIPSNATSQNYIQIRKVFNDKHEEVYKNYERYQGIKELKTVNDTLVRIIILDTMSYKPRVDTMIINILH